ncbi:MAG TPA: hypothetical protein VGN75_13675 [Kaistia sp.]|nr:hypothetical protein [Kaistia sp.]
MSAQKRTDAAGDVSKAFTHAFDMDDPVCLIKDLLVAIDAIAITDVEDPYSSAITRLVTFGEKAINEIGEHRDAIFKLLHGHAEFGSLLTSATVRGAQKGAAA